MELSSPLKIKRIVAGGWGLTHMGAKVTFVRGVLPDEMVTVTPVESHRAYQFATVDHLHEVSPDRIAPPCPLYGQCGGCQFQHVRYETQLRYKQVMLEEAFSRIAHIGVECFLPPVPSPFPYQYRQWVRFSVFQDHKTFHLGFRQERSHKAVKCTDCLLVPDSIRAVSEELNVRLAAMTRMPSYVSSIEVRVSGAFGSCMLLVKSPQLNQGQARSLLEIFRGIQSVTGCIVAAALPPSRRKHAPVRLVEGEDHLFEQFHAATFRVSDRSFMQANWAIYSMIYQTLEEWFGECDGTKTLELYGGIGCLGLSLAQKGALVTVVEENPYAIADARKSASQNRIRRCRFRSTTAEKFLENVQSNEYEVVLLDPPRTGLSKSCIDSLMRIRAGRIFYLSCDAASLARDVSRLGAAGYRVHRAQLFDMFPQTSHIETLSELILN